MTLLEMVQNILSEIDGDEVNSISDTEEAEQVARTVVNTFRNIVSDNNWDHTRRALNLVPRSDNDFPTHIRLDDELKELHFINYNKIKSGETKKNYQPLKWKEPDDFLRYTNMRDSTATTVEVIMDDSGIELMIQNDKAPEYYTTFDDTNIIFDSYDSSVDTTIQSSKIQASGYVVPTLSLSDGAVIDLPPDAVSLLYETALATRQYRGRQMQDVFAEREATRQRRAMSHKSWRTHGGIAYPNYGRKSGRVKDPTFKRNN